MLHARGKGARTWTDQVAGSVSVPVCGGVLADECGDLMRTFFRERSRGRTTSSHIVDVVS